MNFEEIGVIKYGELRFLFNVTKKVSEYLKNKDIQSQNLFPKTQYFYQGVLHKMGISYEEENDLEVVFFSIKLNDDETHDKLEESFEVFENFPMHVGEKIYLLNFGVRMKK